MNVKTMLQHLYKQGKITDYQFTVINRHLKDIPQKVNCKEVSLYQIKDQTITDFSRLVTLTDHGVINYTEFKHSTNVLVNAFVSALIEERKKI